MLHAWHHFKIVLHFDVATFKILSACFHPNLEYSSDAHDHSDFCNNNWAENVAVDRKSQLVVQHHDPERITEKYKHVVVHLEFLTNKYC